jgi:hypothetical protein
MGAVRVLALGWFHAETKKHFSDYLWRKILEREGFRNSGL